MNSPMPCAVTADLKIYEAEQDRAYAAAEEIEDRRDELVMAHLETISADSPEIGDFLGGYVSADPEAMSAHMSATRLSRLPMGVESNREAFIQAALRYFKAVLDTADVEFGDWLVQKELEGQE